MSALYQTNGVDLNIELAMFEAERGLNLPTAIERARAALAERPSIKVAGVLAWALYQSGRHEEARDASRQALRLGTQDALLHFQAGMIAAKLGDRPAATAALDRALAINPHFSPVYAPTRVGPSTSCDERPTRRATSRADDAPRRPAAISHHSFAGRSGERDQRRSPPCLCRAQSSNARTRR